MRMVSMILTALSCAVMLGTYLLLTTSNAQPQDPRYFTKIVRSEDKAIAVVQIEQRDIDPTRSVIVRYRNRWHVFVWSLDRQRVFNIMVGDPDEVTQPRLICFLVGSDGKTTGWGAIVADPFNNKSGIRYEVHKANERGQLATTTYR